MRRGWLLGGVAVLALLVPASAHGAFHLMKVKEVYPGTAANPDSSFIELQMYSGGQNFVTGHFVRVYSATGTSSMTFTMNESAADGDDQDTILLGDTAAGVTPDFQFTGLGQFLNAQKRGGAVCFDGEPDCVSWGNFTGSGSLLHSAGTPALPNGIPGGCSMTRSITPGNPTLLELADDTNNSSIDFARTVASPRNSSDATAAGPACADIDDDGHSDDEDNCPAVANPGQENSDPDGQGNACDDDDDNDGVLDGIDNCASVGNGDQHNYDLGHLNGDVLGDACDDDDDGDGRTDATDNCDPESAMPSTLDWSSSSGTDFDNDGCKDADPGAEDLDDDGDSVLEPPNGSDNCLLKPNPGQANSDQGLPDADLLGDECDGDDDNDGVADAADACPVTAASTSDGCAASSQPPGRTTSVTQLILSFSRRGGAHFSGRYTGDSAICTAARITIFKKVPGKDKRVGSATSNADGDFAKKKGVPPGKYYATAAEIVTETVTCTAAKSKTVRVR